MKNKLFIGILLSAIVLGVSACSNTTDINSDDENQFDVAVSDTSSSADNTETGVVSEIPSIGGSDYSFSRKYVDDVYNIYLAAEIVGEKARNEWVENVLLKKSPTEQEAIPPLYQIIADLKISREDFIKENDKYIEYPNMHLSEDVISALYQEDVTAMKKQLVSPLALYYNEEIYTFDELLSDKNLANTIPQDVISDYLDYIEIVCDKNDVLKDMQNDINSVKVSFGLMSP